jgi:hypothetical protein
LADRPGIVFIEAVGQHDGDAFYASLKHLGVGSVGRRRAEKPGCCGERGWPTLGSTRAQRGAAAER